MNKMKERIDELVEILNEANYNYHVLDNPTITDQEFDKLLRELFILEEKYPEYINKYFSLITLRFGNQFFLFLNSFLF